MNNLKELRINNRYTQTQAAKVSGVSRQAYAKYESGEVEPPLTVLRNLAEFYQVPLERLISNDKPVLYKNIPAGDELLFVNEPSLEMSYGDSMYGIVETAVESMSVSKLKDLYLKISEIIASSEDKKMTLLEFEKYACSSTSLTDGQELVNMLRSGDRDF